MPAGQKQLLSMTRQPRLLQQGKSGESEIRSSHGRPAEAGRVKCGCNATLRRRKLEALGKAEDSRRKFRRSRDTAGAQAEGAQLTVVVGIPLVVQVLAPFFVRAATGRIMGVFVPVFDHCVQQLQGKRHGQQCQQAVRFKTSIFLARCHTVGENTTITINKQSADAKVVRLYNFG